MAIVYIKCPWYLLGIHNVSSQKYLFSCNFNNSKTKWKVIQCRLPLPNRSRFWDSFLLKENLRSQVWILASVIYLFECVHQPQNRGALREHTNIFPPGISPQMPTSGSAAFSPWAQGNLFPIWTHFPLNSGSILSGWKTEPKKPVEASCYSVLRRHQVTARRYLIFSAVHMAFNLIILWPWQ